MLASTYLCMCVCVKAVLKDCRLDFCSASLTMEKWFFFFFLFYVLHQKGHLWLSSCVCKGDDKWEGTWEQLCSTLLLIISWYHTWWCILPWESRRCCCVAVINPALNEHSAMLCCLTFKAGIDSQPLQLVLLLLLCYIRTLLLLLKMQGYYWQT